MRSRALSVFSQVPSKKIRAVICDGAGTLFDYRCQALLALFQSIAERKAAQRVSPEILRAPIGLSKLEHFRCMYRALNVDSDKVDRLAAESVKELEARFVAEVAPAPLIKGSVDAIRQLQKLGIRVAVNSSYPAKVLVEALATHDLAHLPCVTPEYVQRGRPHPDMLFYLMKQMNVTAEETVALGDTGPDIQAAERATVWSALVTDTSAFAVGDANQAFNFVLAKLGEEEIVPNFTIDSIQEVLGLVEMVNSLLAKGETPTSFAKKECHVNGSLLPKEYHSSWHR